MKCRIDITGRKIWEDNDNAHGRRPASVAINLLRDGKVIDTTTANEASGWRYTFPCLPVGNSKTDYVYTVDEAETPAGYQKAINGFNITNTIIVFSFVITKKNEQGTPLPHASFQLWLNGEPAGSSQSNYQGEFSFGQLIPGVYQMVETIPPAGYMADTTVYEVVVAEDGTITIDGLPWRGFTIVNRPIMEE